jgi:protein O-GlcNAc transferase
LKRGNYTGGAEAFQTCLRVRPEWLQAELNLGFAFFRLGDLQAAHHAFETALKIEPGCVDAIRPLAELAVLHEDHATALELQRRLIELGERSPEDLYNTALLLQKEGLVEEAARFYEQALAAKPDFAEAALNLGHLLKSLGREDEALEYWRRALEAKPELAAGYFVSAVA